MTSVCVPVLRRYDMLRQLLNSLRASTVKPEVYVLDNGRDGDRIAAVTAGHVVHVCTPDRPMSVAESWNWFIQNVPEERVIANDDVEFAPDSLERLVAAGADLAWAGCGFSCFLLRDACVRKVGLFDETISPGYAYYEDEDYLQRIDGKGTKPAIVTLANVDCGVVHKQSQTLKVASPAEMAEHHRKFKIAQRNYMAKWSISDEEMFGRRA